LRIDIRLNYHEKLFREIATDTIRVFFGSFDKNVIFAPYDGGVDLTIPRLSLYRCI